MKHSILLPLIAVALLPSTGYSAEATVVSSYEHAILYNADGSVRGSFMNSSWQHGYGLNGGDYTIKLFNGDFEDYCYLNEAGCYIVVDLTKDLSSGYYVTDVKIGHRGNAKYSLYYSENGESWNPVVQETNLGGVRTYSIGQVARFVKFVWNTVIQGTTSLSEIEVWGVDPTELECTHPDEFLTEWEAVPGTANCTEYGIDQRECTKCGTVFHRESPSMLPTGHKYETILVERGTSLAFGSGTNVCTRCGHEVAFPEPRDLVSPLGGFKTSGVVRFTDVSISSFYASWSGIPTTAILDNDWTYSWGKYWAASTKDHGSVYIDYEFAEPIDLTAIDMSVHNHDHIVEFYSLVGDEETLVGSVAIEKDASNASECQRIKVDFRGVTLSTLRVRFKDSVGLNVGSWGNNVITCSELHPYGTVAGAGKSAAVRTRVIID